ncbi:restriction endonuclease subunit S [Escherichia coli]|uniref:restriction endonuclease subunit S n=1 Tax=Enterobacteriaceae TaxID=543 RepID=UPI000650A349|nr:MULTISPECIES: restriction endonuclease subunit S [Enterobacteriaceae]EBG4937531.1 restriction endonuclease subunit S [Salmonella enterica subsp. enterica serovar Enteritidis]ECP8570746.1 restriction endonuclease subunit S [Salmonella enterica subsp. enterica]EGX7507678.1 restriction endonuclease subunit S [Salmonella enterica subsp. enterica serovar 4,[5],12:i:-]EHW4344554.1 restriction endonuclease subunit S [Salmonella enterica subsp. enterica serovar Glostrup]EIW2990536.1 restriction end
MVPKGWRFCKLADISRVTSGGTPNRAISEYWQNGTIPWIRTTEVQNCILQPEDAKEYISELGLRKSSAKLIPENTILLAMIGQGKTRGQIALLKFEAAINQNCAAIIFGKSQEPEFYYHYLLSQYENIRNLSNSAGQSNLSGALVKAINVLVPPYNEQKKIAQILSTWDKAISVTEKLLTNSQQQKKALMQQLLSGKKRLLDENGVMFSGEWEVVRLKQLIHEEKKRNRDNHIQRVLSVTNHSGFVLPEEQFSKRVASEDVSTYKIVKKNQYGYNPSRLNVGSFARLDNYDEGVLSPMYVVFSINHERLNSDYFLNWMSSNEAKQRIAGSTQGSVRDSVGFDALCSFSFSLPTLMEQQKIAAVLSAADAEMSMLEKKLACLKEEKKALMQQLLTGKRRVNVESEETVSA